MDPYESRTGTHWEAADRLDPVIWGETGPLSPAALRRYEEDGFLLLPGLLSAAEVDELLAEARRLAADPNGADDPEIILEPDSDVVRSVFRAHLRSEAFRRLAADPRLVDVARQICGSDVYIHQARINFKPALDGREFYWHSDFETWHIEDGMPRMRAVSASIFLTDSTELNGPLMVIPGSHRTYVRCVGETPDEHYKRSLRKQEYGVPDAEALRLLADNGGLHAPTGVAGSVVLFDCNMMHASTGNLSPYPRTSLFLVYNSVENQLVEPFGGKRPRPGFLGEREAVPVTRRVA